MAHQATDAPVPVKEGVNIVQPVMRRRDREDARAGAERGEAVAAREMRHEGLNHRCRRWQVASDHHLMTSFRGGTLLAPCGAAGFLRRSAALLRERRRRIRGAARG